MLLLEWLKNRLPESVRGSDQGESGECAESQAPSQGRLHFMTGLPVDKQYAAAGTLIGVLFLGRRYSH